MALGLEKKVQDRKNLRWYRGHARFIAPHRVRVAEDELESDRIFINAGARPKIPPIAGLDRINYLTNSSIMELTQLPEHLLILGGGYVGLEFGQMFRRFGSQVTIVDHNDQILPREDADVADELRQGVAERRNPLCPECPDGSSRDPTRADRPKRTGRKQQPFVGGLIFWSPPDAGRIAMI